MPRALWRSWGGGGVSYERGTAGGSLRCECRRDPGAGCRVLSVGCKVHDVECAHCGVEFLVEGDGTLGMRAASAQMVTRQRAQDNIWIHAQATRMLAQATFTTFVTSLDIYPGRDVPRKGVPH